MSLNICKRYRTALWHMLASQLEAENLSYYCNMHVFSYDINRVGIAVIKASSSINVMCVTVIIKRIVLMLFQ